MPRETGGHAEATPGARTPWRLWACGAGCPRLEGGGHRSVSSRPSPVNAKRGRSNPGSPTLTMRQELLTRLPYRFAVGVKARTSAGAEVSAQVCTHKEYTNTETIPPG